MPSSNHTAPTAKPPAFQLPALLEVLPVPLWLKDPQGIHLACNPAHGRLLGAAPADLVGRSDDELVAADVAEAE